MKALAVVVAIKNIIEASDLYSVLQNKLQLCEVKVSHTDNISALLGTKRRVAEVTKYREIRKHYR